MLTMMYQLQNKIFWGGDNSETYLNAKYLLCCELEEEATSVMMSQLGVNKE